MLFRRRKQEVERIHELEKRVAIEVPKKEKQKAQAIAKTTKVADNFTKVLKENHFTIKIHAATSWK